MLEVGDHLRTPRLGYWHHGIYVGDGRVIQYAGMSTVFVNDGPVEETSLDAFRAGATYEVVPHPRRRFSPEESVARARSRVGEQHYGLAGNNCEHFVSWCIQGDHQSSQVDVGVPVATAGLTGAVGAAALVATGAAATGVVGAAAGGAGIMSGLATVGAVVGGGAVAGIGTLAAAPAVAAASLVNMVVLPDGTHLDESERDARQAGRVASYAGAAVGTAGAIGAVAAAGTAGLGAAGITSGLAAIGTASGLAAVVGPMAAGIAVTTAAPVALAMGAGYGLYKAWKWLGA